MKLSQHQKAAIQWHVQLMADDADWAAFTLWLEADPAHQRAYDAVAAADRVIDNQLAVLRARLPANDVDDQSAPAPKWRAARPALAAGLLALLGVAVTLWRPDAQAPQSFATRNAPREIALADGARIILDRNSALLLNRGKINAVTLTKGAAFFIAPPDPAPSFDVRVGAYQLRDIGTQFTLGQAGDKIQLQVADGAVRLTPPGSRALQVQRGQGLEISARTAQSRLYKVRPSTIGRWRTGQLSYEETPVTVVISDIARSSGLTVEVDPRIADQRFTGVLTIGDGTRLVSDFSDLTGFVADRQGQIVHLRPRN